ncbi:MAG: PEP-CTERM sorting domain-containing protein [Casimicrobiaceae bacterium]
MKIWQLAVAAVLLVASSLASANVQYTFYASGVTESYSQQGTALFNFSNDGSSLSITLTDTVDPTAAVLSSITGLQFGLSSVPTGMSLTSVTAAQVVDCTNSSSPCPPGSGSSPYGWGSMATGSGFSLGAGFDGSAFSYQPYGIVNANYLSPGGAGGLGDPAVNPLLVGPVTFNFALSGMRFAPEVNSVVFEFGDPIGVNAVPEPQSLALLAAGLLAAGWVSRRKFVRA